MPGGRIAATPHMPAPGGLEADPVDIVAADNEHPAVVSEPRPCAAKRCGPSRR
jgi:hypothetical protein